MKSPIVFQEMKHDFELIETSEEFDMMDSNEKELLIFSIIIDIDKELLEYDDEE